MPLQFSTYTRCGVVGRAVSLPQRFFNLPCFEQFINVIDSLSDPSHDINALTIAARLIPVAIWTEFSGFIPPRNPCVIVWESHQSLAFNRHQSPDA